MTEDKKSYYAVIPANVRYDKDLTMGARLLYGEITALCNEKGFCWASNNYFAELYGVSKTTISTWIKQLIDKNYILSDIEYKEGTKEILNRYLRIFKYPTQENLNTPIQKNLKDNNTLSNNTINKTAIDDFFETLWKAYPKKKGKGDVSKTQKDKLYKIGIDEMLRAIERYKLDIVGTDMKYVKNGSTFFNSGYVDYLDANYDNVDEEKPIQPKINYEGSNYEW